MLSARPRRRREDPAGEQMKTTREGKVEPTTTSVREERGWSRPACQSDEDGSGSVQKSGEVDGIDVGEEAEDGEESSFGF